MLLHIHVGYLKSGFSMGSEAKMRETLNITQVILRFAIVVFCSTKTSNKIYYLSIKLTTVSVKSVNTPSTFNPSNNNCNACS